MTKTVVLFLLLVTILFFAVTEQRSLAKGDVIEYRFENGHLCFEQGEVFEFRDKRKDRAPKYELLIKLQETGLVLNYGNEYNPKSKESLFLLINDLSVSRKQYVKSHENFRKKIGSLKPEFNSDLNLFIYTNNGDSDQNEGLELTRTSYLLKENNLNLWNTANIDTITNSYLGKCSESVKDMPICHLEYVYDNALIIEYHIAEFALHHWREIESLLNARMHENKCPSMTLKRDLSS